MSFTLPIPWEQSDPSRLLSGRPIAVPMTRVDLAEAFAKAGFRTGAEVGVERGLYSEVMLKANPGLYLRCVDAWRARRGYREHVSQSKLDLLHAEAVHRLSPFFWRCDIVRDLSVNAAERVQDGSLDFVYIDAAHDLPSVISDLAAWSPKVRSGGVIAGHDYRSVKGKAGAVFHVKQAVHAWTDAYKIRPWFVLTGDRSASWLWMKP